MHNQQIGQVDCLCNWCQILHGVIWKLGIDIGIDGVAGGDFAGGVSIRRGSGDGFRANDAACTGLVFHNELLARALREALGDGSGDRVQNPACCGCHHDFDWLVRVGRVGPGRPADDKGCDAGGGEQGVSECQFHDESPSL